MILLAIILFIIIKIFDLKLDYTRDNHILLWYTLYQKRKYLILIKL